MYPSTFSPPFYGLIIPRKYVEVKHKFPILSYFFNIFIQNRFLLPFEL
nr:MAG TPA: hypothetical protein [Caudoviricetes sp.]